MPLKRRRSPQEKKALSYTKDRRCEFWGASNKGDRKSVPRSKARSHRSTRRTATTKLSTYEALDEVGADLVENELLNDVGKFKRFKKDAGVPLGEAIELAQAKRERLAGRKRWSKKMRQEADCQGATGYMSSWGGSEAASFFKIL